MPVSKKRTVQVVKVPNRYLIMDGDSLLASSRREFQVAEICNANGWLPGAVQEFGAWLLHLTKPSKPKKGTASKPN